MVSCGDALRGHSFTMRIGACIVGYVILVAARAGAAQTFQPDIPRAWENEETARFELPLAQRDRTPRFLTASEYYAQKVRTIYRTYPVYVNGREPAGCFDSLKQKEPEVIFDSSKLRSREDWIRAGEVVFRASPRMTPVSRSLQFPPGISIPATSDGIVPNLYYVVRKRGTVELATESCSDCHTRVLAGGHCAERRSGKCSRRSTGRRQRETSRPYPGPGPTNARNRVF